jgi:hypothetical protein
MRAHPLVLSLPLLIAACGVGFAAEPAKPQAVTIRFALQSGNDPVACGQDVKGLGVNKISAKLRDARFYISAPALIDKAGKEVPIALDHNEWQYANVVLLDFENKTGSCNGTEGMNTVIAGAIPPGRYKGLTFTVGVPSVVKGEDGKDVVLNHSNTATAPAPLDLQSMAWSWQAGRKFIRFEIEPEGGVTRKPQPPRPEGARGEGGRGEGGEGASAEGGRGGGRPEGQREPREQPRVNADGTITVTKWMLHFGSTGCKGDALIGDIVSCASPNRAPVTLASFDPATQQVVLDLQSLVAGIDLNRDEGGATGCMSNAADPECAKIFENLGVNLKQTALDANDQGQPSKAGGHVFRVAPRTKLADKQ